MTVNDSAEVMAIKMKRGENKKGQDGAGSDKPSVLRFLEQYDDQLQKNSQKNKFLERLKASYESDPTTPQYDPELGLPRGREFQEHLGMYDYIFLSCHSLFIIIIYL